MGYEELAKVLSRAGTEAEMAELHGSLCARLSLCGETALAGWLSEALAGVDADGAAWADARRELAAVHQATWATLVEGDMALALLLPTDSAPLEARVGALALWSQGFLHGLASCGVPAPEQLRAAHGAAHAAEFMEDLVEISRAGFEADADEVQQESAEAAYAELVEFLRAGVLISFEELEALRAAVTPERPAPSP